MWLILILLILTFLVPFGIWEVASYVGNFPTKNTIKYAKGSRYLGRESPTSIDDLAETVAKPFVRFIKMDELAKQELAIALEASENKDSPEMHLTKSIVVAVLSFIIALIFMLFAFIAGSSAFLIGLFVVVLGLAYAFLRYRKPIRYLKKLREQIEHEVPRFATTIGEGLKTERDVLKLLMGYRVVAGEAFGKELDRTIADMKTSNYENALLRFDYRINSPYLSDVIKGLLGALRGDDQTGYFNMLCMNLKSYEKSLLMKKAAKRPAKMNRISLSMLLSLIILYVVVFGTVIVDSLSIFNF